MAVNTNNPPLPTTPAHPNPYHTHPHPPPTHPVGQESATTAGDQFGGIYIDEASNDLLVDSPAGGTTIIDGVSIVSELNKLVSAVLLQRRHLNGGAPHGLGTLRVRGLHRIATNAVAAAAAAS